MPGKYSHLRQSLERYVEEPSYQQKITARQEEFVGFQRGDLAVAYAKARNRKEELEAQLKEENLTIAALESLILQALESQGETQLRHKDAGLLSIKDTPYATIKDRNAFLTWISETNQEALLTVNYQTMSGLVNDRLIEGQPVPPGVKVFMKVSLSRRK